MAILPQNLTSRQVAISISIPISIFTIVGTLAAGTGIYISLIIGGCIGIIAFIFIATAFQEYIERKIKLIYKLIYQTKATKREEFYYKNVLPPQTIEEVNRDVEGWAQQHKDEIEILRRNEAYRKEFLLNLSHELKTPIFAIQGYVDTLRNGAMENPEINSKFLNNTSRNVDRLVNLLNDLDEISKLESGEQLFYKESFNIQDLLREIFETLSIKADERHIRYGIRKECEQPLSVYADKEKIRQVLINLVDNAIKYGKDHGSIEGSMFQVDGRKVLVEITDNGAGISEEHLPRIFERFYRTDLSRNRKVGGSGLGLSICKHIIEAHGETIHARSKVDVGSSFGFTLSSRA